jgi:hypothetical protein
MQLIMHVLLKEMRIYLHNELEEKISRKVTQLLLFLPSNLQDDTRSEVKEGLSCDFFGEPQNKEFQI